MAGRGVAELRGLWGGFEVDDETELVPKTRVESETHPDEEILPCPCLQSANRRAEDTPLNDAGALLLVRVLSCVALFLSSKSDTPFINTQ